MFIIYTHMALVKHREPWSQRASGGLAVAVRLLGVPSTTSQSERRFQSRAVLPSRSEHFSSTDIKP